MNHKDGGLQTPMHMAACNGHVSVVQALVSAGAEAQPVKARTCVCVCVCRGVVSMCRSRFKAWILAALLSKPCPACSMSRRRFGV